MQCTAGCDADGTCAAMYFGANPEETTHYRLCGYCKAGYSLVQHPSAAYSFEAKCPN